MPRTIRFRLNGELIETEIGSSGGMVLDWLRRDRRLTGTKEGCREGDCGACMVLLGQRRADGSGQEWIPVNSCLLALEELDGRQLVTVEGLASEGPTAPMLALHGENASQCGFCSPGVAVALTARLVEGGPIDEEELASALEGNLCRCTGYASLRRAAAALASAFAELPAELAPRLAVLAEKGALPAALARSMAEPPPAPALAAPEADPERVVGGGTDWFVHGRGDGDALDFTDKRDRLRTIRLEGDVLELGAAVTVRDFFASETVASVVPGIVFFEAEVASPPIRSRATVAGNIANASPVADLTAMLLALDGRLRLRSRRSGEGRELPLSAYFLGYKKTAAAADEYIEAVLIPEAQRPRVFSFEKAAKRSRLDIAAVNSALCCSVGGTAAAPVLSSLRISAGGVGPIPLLLSGAAAAACAVPLNAQVVRDAARAAADEVRPISDARGSADYRRSMTFRLVAAHFVRLFPELRLEEALL